MAGEDLYEMLGVDKAADQATIRKAYLRLALQVHPDRNPDPEATAKFQALQRIYAVLSDPTKRQAYDRTGSLQDCEDMGGDFADLYSALREATKVTEQDLDAFTLKYRGSAEERSDLLRHYREFNGDMPRVFDWLMLSRPDLDSHRFRDTLEAAVAAGEIKATKAFKAWSAKVAATPPPSRDPLAPPKAGRKKKPHGEADDSLALVAAIKNKQTAFTGMLAALEAKYAGGSSSGGGRKKQQKKQQQQAPSGKRRRQAAAAAAAESDDETLGGGSSGSEPEGADETEPTEAEFAAAQARLQQRKAAGTAAAAAGKQRKGGGGGKGSSSNGSGGTKRAAVAAEGGKRRKRA